MYTIQPTTRNILIHESYERVHGDGTQPLIGHAQSELLPKDLQGGHIGIRQLSRERNITESGIRFEKLFQRPEASPTQFAL